MYDMSVVCNLAIYLIGFGNQSITPYLFCSRSSTLLAVLF